MNQRLLAELTAMVAAHAPLVIEADDHIPEGLLWTYWQHSQSLLRQWRRNVQQFAASTQQPLGLPFASIAAEILVTEMLTRVWGAVLTAADLHRGCRHSEPIARSVLKAHQQCRAELLNLMLHCPNLPIDRMAELDRLRRRVERWTDLLLGPFVLRFGDDLADFAFDVRRAREFGQEPMLARFGATSLPAWNLLLVGLRSAFSKDRFSNAPTKLGLQSPILRSIMATFPADAFQDSGPIKSIGESRIFRSGRQPDRQAPATKLLAARRLRWDFKIPASPSPRHTERRRSDDE